MFLPPMQGYCHLCIFPVSLSKEQDFRYWKLSELTRQSKRRTKEDRHRLKRLKSISYHLMRRNQSRQLRTALRFTHQTFTVFFFIVPSVFMMNKNIYMGINSKPNETNVTKTISLKKKSLFEKNKDNSLPYWSPRGLVTQSVHCHKTRELSPLKEECEQRQEGLNAFTAEQHLKRYIFIWNLCRFQMNPERSPCCCGTVQVPSHSVTNWSWLYVSLGFITQRCASVIIWWSSISCVLYWKNTPNTMCSRKGKVIQFMAMDTDFKDRLCL